MNTMSEKKIELTIRVTELDSEKELSKEEQELLNLTREKAKQAYAPYSTFHVGAGLLLENGKTFFGSNQENAAYPSGLCAERVALFGASAQYPGVKFRTLVITCSPGQVPLTPCGACRQVISEYEKLHHSPLRLILSGETGKVWVVDKASDLLPFAFDGSKLKK
jgi:cytidine deaminase